MSHECEDGEYRVELPGEGTCIGQTRPFDKALRLLRHKHSRAPLPLTELARMRIKQPYTSPLCNYGSFVKEALVYTAAGKTYFVRNSPLCDIHYASAARAQHDRLEQVQGTADVHRGFGEIYFGEILPPGLWQHYLTICKEDTHKPLIQRRVFELDRQTSWRVPCREFAQVSLLCWLFGGPERASAYGDYLLSAGIDKTPVWLVDWLKQDNSRPAFLRQLYFGNIPQGSSINGGRRLGFDDGAMSRTWGIREE